MTEKFTQEFVINTTLNKWEEAVAYSMEKTSSRVGDFEGDKETSEEILRTMMSLSNLMSLVRRIRNNHEDILNPTIAKEKED